MLISLVPVITLESSWYKRLGPRGLVKQARSVDCEWLQMGNLGQIPSISWIEVSHKWFVNASVLWGCLFCLELWFGDIHGRAYLNEEENNHCWELVCNWANLFRVKHRASERYIYIIKSSLVLRAHNFDMTNCEWLSITDRWVYQFLSTNHVLLHNSCSKKNCEGEALSEWTL